MICCNGSFIGGLNEASSDFLQAFSSQNHITEKFRVEHGRIIFWEAHYFRLMAAMRIMRMDIPMSFTQNNSRHGY